MVEVSYAMSLFYRLFILSTVTYLVLWIATRLSNIAIADTKMIPVNSYFSTDICISGFSCVGDITLGIIFGLLIPGTVMIGLAIYEALKNHYVSWVSQHEKKYDRCNIKYHYVWYLCRKLIVAMVITKWIMWGLARLGGSPITHLWHKELIIGSFGFFTSNICGTVGYSQCFLSIWSGIINIILAGCICCLIALCGLVIYYGVKNDYQAWKKKITN